MTQTENQKNYVQNNLKSMSNMELSLQLNNHKWLAAQLYQDVEALRNKIRDIEIELITRGGK